MNSDWSIHTVGEIAAPSKNALATGPFGSSISFKHLTETGIPVIRGTNLTERIDVHLDDEDMVFVSEERAKDLKKAIVYPGDLIFTCWGTIGPVGLIDHRARYDRYIISNKQMKLTPDPNKADSLFLYYLFSGPTMSSRIKNEVIGSSISGFNLGQLRALTLNLPPLQEQRSIAQLLGSIDDKIELNHHMSATLEDMTRAIYKSWFVDFDPVHAKARGDQPTGMDAGTAALFPDMFDQSGQGLIPAGWQTQAIQDVAIVNDRTLRASDKLERIEYVEISSVMRGDVHKISIYDKGNEPNRARRRLRHGDTVLSMVRPDRRTYFLCLNPSPYLIASSAFAVITPTNVPWSFLYAALTQPEVSDYLGNLAEGGAFPAVRAEIIGEWPVIKPSTDYLLDKFQGICAPLCELADYNRRESHTLAKLRDTLLPRLVSGEIRVEELKNDRPLPDQATDFG